MTVINNATLILKDKQGNEGIVKSFTDNDINKISNAITDVGQVVDPATHMPIEATTASVGVVQLATAQDITNGTANKVVDAKELAAAIRKLNPGGSGIEGGAGLELGDIGLAPLGIDETDNCRRYLNGQVILQSQFEAFTTKLKSAIALYPDLSTTETNWQSAVTLSPLGQCGKFVIDDEAGTIRLPKVVNVMGALDLSSIGELQSAGLPNITGDFMSRVIHPATSSGALIVNAGNSSQQSYSDSETSDGHVQFDASRSNSIYGNSETVQQEAIKYPYFIQVATSNNEDVQIDTQVRLNNPFSLFMPYWSPIELNNLSWLRSNKQWNNGSVYVSAYEFLLSKYNSGTEQTETISGVSVTYKLADNGMKIITDKSVYDALISASGSAWFFVLDTENTQFILPYTNGFAQFGGELGKFSEAGLPNITGWFGAEGNQRGAGGALSIEDYSNWYYGNQYGVGHKVTLNASRSSSIYGKSNTVQPNSITGYLYFYIGEVEQDANIIATSGLAESVSRKADNDLSNVTAPTQAFKDMSIGWNIPDYSAGIVITSSPFTAPSDGVINANGVTAPNIGGWANLYINGKIICSQEHTSNWIERTSSEFIIGKGDVLTYSNITGTLTFFPYKGAN